MQYIRSFQFTGSSSSSRPASPPNRLGRFQCSPLKGSTFLALIAPYEPNITERLLCALPSIRPVKARWYYSIPTAHLRLFPHVPLAPCTAVARQSIRGRKAFAPLPRLWDGSGHPELEMTGWRTSMRAMYRPGFGLEVLRTLSCIYLAASTCPFKAIAPPRAFLPFLIL
ncbi:hypothetical protein BDU57DRAFT_522080 [Ampelomyces quisqualis]|uniref:Uncharacterized protein n=1 Tax=Ampelomyces quisqualis TaxID=50730 RepID=A0A6A5QEM5_AMPQU|nr:hypothetical protein BDU57DRAFT_522080 [Ampelomyces quisqualis]